LKSVNIKLELLERMSVYEKTHDNLKFFIQTKAEPAIYYLPKQLNSTHEEKLKETRDLIEKQIQEYKEQIQKEIDGLGSDEQQEPATKKQRLPSEEDAESLVELQNEIAVEEDDELKHQQQQQPYQQLTSRTVICEEMTATTAQPLPDQDESITMNDNNIEDEDE